MLLAPPWPMTCIHREHGCFAASVRRFNMFTILIILLVLALLGGGLGHGRYGYAGWSPAGILVIVLLVLFLSGHRL